MVRRLSAIADHIETLEVDYVDLTDAELRAQTDVFKAAPGRRRDARRRAARGVRGRARVGPPHARPVPLQGPVDGRGRPAPGQHRRDEDRRGQDPRLDAARVPQRAVRRRRARGHRQRLPGQPRRRLDGPRAPVPRPDRRQDRQRPPARAPPGRVRLRHHLRHQQRVRLRLPARQHGLVDRGPRTARPQLRHRRRGRLDSDRRGPHSVDHQWSGRGEPALVHGVRPAVAADAEGHPLRGRRG